MFALDIYLLDSKVPVTFERSTREARDELVASFFLKRPPPPILSALETDDPTTSDTTISIVRAYVGKFECRES